MIKLSTTNKKKYKSPIHQLDGVLYGIQSFHTNIRKCVDTKFSFVPYKMIDILPDDIYINFLINLDTEEKRRLSNNEISLFQQEIDSFTGNNINKSFEQFVFEWQITINKELIWFDEEYNQNDNISDIIKLFVLSLTHEDNEHTELLILTVLNFQN